MARRTKACNKVRWAEVLYDDDKPVDHDESNNTPTIGFLGCNPGTKKSHAIGRVVLLRKHNRAQKQFTPSPTSSLRNPAPACPSYAARRALAPRDAHENDERAGNAELLSQADVVQQAK